MHETHPLQLAGNKQTSRKSSRTSRTSRMSACRAEHAPCAMRDKNGNFAFCRWYGMRPRHCCYMTLLAKKMSRGHRSRTKLMRMAVAQRYPSSSPSALSSSETPLVPSGTPVRLTFRHHCVMFHPVTESLYDNGLLVLCHRCSHPSRLDGVALSAPRHTVSCLFARYFSRGGATAGQGLV